MKQYLLIGIVVLALTSWYSVSALFTARSELRASVVHTKALEGSLRALQERTGRIQGSVSKVITESTEKRQEVSNVLQEHPDWSSTPVPVSIQSGLCSAISCADPGATPVR